MNISKKISGLIEEIDHFSGPFIQIFSNKKVIVEDCYGINEYSSDVVRVNLVRGQLLILGCDLEIVSMEDKTVIIKGAFTSIEFIGDNL